MTKARSRKLIKRKNPSPPSQNATRGEKLPLFALQDAPTGTGKIPGLV